MVKLTNERDSNWNLYDNGHFVMTIAKKESGSSNSVFGNYNYFKLYVDHNLRESNGEFIKELTKAGKELYRKSGGEQI